MFPLSVVESTRLRSPSSKARIRCVQLYRVTRRRPASFEVTSSIDCISDRVERLSGARGSRGSDQVAGSLDQWFRSVGAYVVHNDHQRQQFERLGRTAEPLPEARDDEQ